MTEVEAAVRQLGKAIQADPRFTAYWRAKADNDADTDLQNDIQAFNLKKMSYQHETEKLEMNAMMQEVDTILSLCANGEDPDKCHPDLSNCSGNCASCGGCH